MTEIVMPQLSDSMEQGLVLQWLIEDGAEVQVGAELVEIETDKATMTYEAEVEGTLSIVVPEGETVAVGDVIARVGPATGGADEDAQSDAASEEAIEPKTEEIAPEVAQPSGNGATHNSGNGAGTVDDSAAATPVARRLAAVHGISLGTLEGTGPRGRITKSDVLTAAGVDVAGTVGAAAGVDVARPVGVAGSAEATAGPRPSGGGETRTEQLTRRQQVVARRMAQAKSTIPHFQVQTEVAIDRALALRGELKALAASDESLAVPSVNDLIVKACALALVRHPHANGSYKDDQFELHQRVNVGVAVATEGALVVPTVYDADAKSLQEIARDTRRLAERVRSGEITPPELSGATFTVSNLGMYGMTAITPVINPPQAAILGVGMARQTLARDADGAIVDRGLLTLTLSCDHRILYGADAARFLADVKGVLEAPLRLVIG